MGDDAAVTIAEATCESDCETPLRWWGNTLLECAIRSRAPAHTIVQFGYGGRSAMETGTCIE